MYSLLKVIHIGSLILWLGPALGSWLVLRYFQQQQGEISSGTSLVYKVFFLTLTLEHLALCTLLMSGAWMAFGYGWIDMPWLQNKLLLVLLLIVPLEIVDIWLGNWKVQQLIKKRSLGEALTSRQQNLIQFYHKGFTNLALLTLPVTVLAIMWLAVSKQPLW
ncbi:DUF2269 family protein [Rheinheimera mangrovi]|jgi:uncharacterized membrane protein|uniref:DUF2269 family protein n=1 Tax=Rheinheimera mangrovi TaxID=2498451 RepID=UPI000F8DB618|nr:DUF2269 family protein [Rheinheimera mangrovi]